MQKLLIIDDDPKMYRMYKTIFAMENFEVDVAEDGGQGVEKAKSFQPDVILLDIMMPNVNGLDTLKTLKSDDAVRAIPVVVLSNVSDTTVVNDAKANGAAQFVVKANTEPADMVALVRALLAKLASMGATPNGTVAGPEGEGDGVAAAPEAGPTAGDAGTAPALSAENMPPEPEK